MAGRLGRTCWRVSGWRARTVGVVVAALASTAVLAAGSSSAAPASGESRVQQRGSGLIPPDTPAGLTGNAAVVALENSGQMRRTAWQARLTQAQLTGTLRDASICRGLRAYSESPVTLIKTGA